MSARDEVVTGGRELDDLLKTLSPKMEKNVMRSALRAGAKVILEEVKQRIPVDSGALRDSARITGRAKAGSVSASVKVGNSQAWYAHLVEFGTRPHVIKAKNQGSLSFGGRTVEQVNHPGISGHPFMRPAAEEAFSPAVAAVKRKVRERLTKQGINVPDTIPQDPEQ